MSISRRHLLQGSAALASLPLAKFGGAAHAQSEGAPWRHSLSLFGELKYPAGFKHFDYVNPNAPKGGVARQISLGTFDSFNIAIAGVKGSVAPGVARIYETLMTSSLDEISTEYGLLVEQVSHPDDFTWATYRLRKEARWHDGKPVTPEDVIFSLEQLKKLSPRYGSYYNHVVKAEKVGDQDVKFTFDQPGNRELPVIVGQLMVLPKHWWEGTDKDGKKRDISATTLEPPLGSGPYRIKDFSPGRTLVLERVKDYWGEKLPVNIGQNNFDELRYEFFRDNIVALEAFKADQADWIQENSAKQWATAYDFPAARDKRVLLEEFSMRASGRMQGFVFNLRRDLFKDARFRRAFNYAYDFEEMNKQLFYGQYKRIASYFEGTELASGGLPEGKELEILETVRGKVPAEVFTTVYSNPVNGNAENVRNNRREVVAPVQGGGLRDQGPEAGRPERQAGLGGISDPAGSQQRAVGPVLQAPTRAARHQRLRARRRQCAVPEPAAQLRLRHHHRRVGPVALARQRAARVLGIARRRPAGLRKQHRHQEPGRRRAHPEGDLRQGSRHAGGGDQGARPRPALESLCGAAVHLRLCPLCALGPLQPRRAVAEIWRLRPSRQLWWWDAQKAAKTGGRT